MTLDIAELGEQHRRDGEQRCYEEWEQQRGRYEND